jgi:hypothetical protein
MLFSFCSELRLHIEELHNLYSSPSIIRIIKSTMNWTGHVAWMRAKILVGKPEGKRPLGRPSHKWVGNIKMNLRKNMWWIGLIWLRIGTVEGSYEHGNEPLGSIECWEVLELLHNWPLFKKGSAPWVSCELRLNTPGIELNLFTSDKSQYR